VRGPGEDHHRVRATGRGHLTELVKDRGEGPRRVKATGRALLAGLGETPGRRLVLATGGVPTRGEHLLTTTIAFDLRLPGRDMKAGAKP
jgi:hypothetical protein